MKNSIKKVVLTGLVLVLLTGCTKTLKSVEDSKKTVINPKTGQSLTENILCRPTDEETIKLYLANNVDLSKLPYCVCEEEYVTDDSKYKLPEKEETVETTEESKTEEAKKEEKKEETKVPTPSSEEEQKEEVTEEEKTKCKAFKVTTGGYEGLWTSIFVKPLAWLILFLGKYLSNFGLGLIAVTILIRLVMYPLTRKTAMQSEMMKKIQPELDRLEKKYAKKDQNDRQVMMAKSQEMMAIYKKNNFNPMTGCLASLIQLPIFIAFLEAINRIPALFEEKFLGLHLGTSPSVGIGNGNWLYVIVIIVVGVTTFISFKNTSNTGNEATQKQTKTMMNVFLVMIVVMSVFMTTALGLYWSVSNLFTIGQNYLVKRRAQDVK